MLIEYQIKFEKNGFTLTQRIESGASDQQAETRHVVEENGVKASYGEGKAATVAGPKSGGSPGSTPGETFLHLPVSGAPAIFIGPFIMCCPHDDSQKKGKE